MLLPDADEVLHHTGRNIPVRLGVGQGGGQQIVSASSTDGLDWRVDGAVVVPDGHGPDAVKASEMCLFQLPAGAVEGMYGMVYEGCDGTAPNARGVWRIARAFAQ